MVHHQSDNSVIPSTADHEAFRANAEAIDRQVRTDRYFYIIAWGKWLGFTPQTVERYVRTAEFDDAPVDAVQKIDDEWIRLGDIANEANRKRVEEIARRGL